VAFARLNGRVTPCRLVSGGEQISVGIGFFVPAIAIAGWLVSFAALAGVENGLVVRGAVVRATVPGQSVAGAYLEIESTEEARLVGGESDSARAVDLHSMSMEGGVMRMRQLESLRLPARTAVKLSPGGVHLMLVGVSRVLRPGEHVRLTLKAVTSGGKTLSVTVDAPVLRAGDAIAPDPAHGSGGRR
jgi:periplasmic copper chaperone A